jgi:NAD-dependent deacetylase
MAEEKDPVEKKRLEKVFENDLKNRIVETAKYVQPSQGTMEVRQRFVEMPGSTPPTIVILTGAGISAESGLPTFRDAAGLWHGHRVEEVATPEAFAANPALVHEFYNMRRAALKTVRPNAAHEAIARLQREHPGEVVLITQNVDDLHERGGSPSVIHMHGEIRKVRCAWCNMGMAWEDELSMEMACGSCVRSGGMRPDIVWFGEMPAGWSAAATSAAISSASR